MYIHISFAEQEKNSLPATDWNVRHSMSTLRLLMPLLLILLAALLAVWVAGPEGRVVAGEGRTVVPARLDAAGTSTPVADSTESGAAGGQVENQFPNPESWYEDTSPYAHEPLAISSGGGGMNLPK